MKKVIDGKLYNTETAQLLLTLYIGSRHAQRDYYMTKKRAFFVHYVEVNDLDLVPEKTIADLLMRYDVDKYIKIFGDVEEG